MVDVNIVCIVSSETRIFSYGYLSKRHPVFTWARTGRAVIFRGQKGVPEQKRLGNTGVIDVPQPILKWISLWLCAYESSEHIVPVTFRWPFISLLRHYRSIGPAFVSEVIHDECPQLNAYSLKNDSVVDLATGVSSTGLCKMCSSRLIRPYRTSQTGPLKRFWL
jgi:hypothetical protein